jgi:membrane-bound lytic murein transglycosylase B
LKSEAKFISVSGGCRVKCAHYDFTLIYFFEPCHLCAPWFKPQTCRVYPQFIDEMVEKHQFKKEELVQLFKQVEYRADIIAAITAPAQSSRGWNIAHHF